MEYGKRIVLAVLAMTTLGQAHPVWSAASARDRAPPAPESARENGGFLELGLTAQIERHALAHKNPDDNGDGDFSLGVMVSAGYQHDRYFVEATDSWFGGLNLGVNLLQTPELSVDLLLANIAGHISIESDEPPAPVTEQERNDAILDRDSLFIAAGTRITAYRGDSLLQLRLLSDWYDDNGLQASARLGHRWQVGNWNFQGIVGARYYSSTFNNYLYGVTDAEASQRFPSHTTGHAWIPEVELGASYPLSRDWVYTSRLRFKQLPASVTDSPLVTDDQEIFLTTGIHYVF
ncbi:MipA/OmpV family protein [Granulosicoccus sp. 3-233]|uniref:MipA/OmpV family protein n=1 Tax=Granulosicoccus sp. 3-233 TaxID=3417969 RepID=UPI003D33CE6C